MADTRRLGVGTMTASKTNVVQQAKLMDDAGSAWHAVKYGNLEVRAEGVCPALLCNISSSSSPPATLAPPHPSPTFSPSPHPLSPPERCGDADAFTVSHRR